MNISVEEIRWALKEASIMEYSREYPQTEHMLLVAHKLSGAPLPNIEAIYESTITKGAFATVY